MFGIIEVFVRYHTSLCLIFHFLSFTVIIVHHLSDDFRQYSRISFTPGACLLIRKRLLRPSASRTTHSPATVPEQRRRARLAEHVDDAVADGCRQSGSVQSPRPGELDNPHFALWSMMSHEALPLNSHVFFTTNIKQMMRNLQMMVFHNDKQSKQS